MNKIKLIWRRLGKEHGERMGFQLNGPDVVERHLQAQLARFTSRSSDHWPAWQVSDDLLMERPPQGKAYGPDSLIYLLPREHWTIVENVKMPPEFGEDWAWYVHIGDIHFSPATDCWIMTDLFCDVIIQGDCKTHSVLDLDDLATAVDIGLIQSQCAGEVLRHTQALVDLVRAGGFPPRESARPGPNFSSMN